MVVYKLTYFNWKARGEVAWMLFAIADIKFEDVRIEFSEWPKFKKSITFGKLPVLEVDGKVICQSHAIERYLAKQFRLMGDTDWDQARVDMVVECMEDFLASMLKIYYCKDETQKADLTETFLDEDLPHYMNNFDMLISENEGGGGFIVGDQLTLADLAVYHHPEGMRFCVGKDMDWSPWPRLQRLRRQVQAHPRVAAWLKTRPATAV